MTETLQIAIVGAGRIGSTFAFHLARAGHDVTLIARGQRLAELEQDPAIELVSGSRETVKVQASIDLSKPWDLLLVTVLAHQADALLPSLHVSAAKTVMFMFNTVEPLERLRDAVGEARFAFGFPTVMATFVGGRLKCSVDKPGQMTTVTSEVWSDVFNRAGIPAEVHADMESFLRSHAAFVIPLMAMGYLVHTRGRGISWTEARRYARAMSEAFGIVQQLGHRVTPSLVAALSRMPFTMRAALLWCLSRLAAIQELGAMGPSEARALIDKMTTAGPGPIEELLAIRP
jgi:2-dehydropantoate 2-reductase